MSDEHASVRASDGGSIHGSYGNLAQGGGSGNGSGSGVVGMSGSDGDGPASGLPETDDSSPADMAVAAEEGEAGTEQETSTVVRDKSWLFGAALIISASVGSGIFTLPQDILKASGSTGFMMVFLAVGAFLSFVGAMCYSEWNCRVPQSGGDASFLDASFKRPQRFLGFLFSWSRVLFMNPGYAVCQADQAAKFFIAARGLDPGSKENKLYRFQVTVFVLVLLSFVCSVSKKIKDGVFHALTWIVAAVIISIAIIGLKGPVNDKPDTAITVDNAFAKIAEVEKPSYAMAMLYVMWIFDGWNNLASSAGMIRKPNVNIPIGNAVGVATVSISYILAVLGYLRVLTIRELTDASFISIFASSALVNNSSSGEAISGFTAAKATGLINGIICFCVFSSCFSVIYSAANIAQATGEMGMILAPKFFAKIHDTFGTPFNGVVVTLACALIMTFVGTIPESFNLFSFLVTSISFLAWVFILLTLVGLLNVKYKEGSLFKILRPESLKHLGVWLPAFVPFLLSVFIIVMLIFTFLDDTSSSGFDAWQANIAGVAITLAGAIPYLFMFQKERTTNFFNAAAKPFRKNAQKK